MGKGWGGAIDTISGMVDGIFGLSPEQRKRKIKDKIDKLEQKKKDIMNEKATIDRACSIDNLNRELSSLRKELNNI